MLTEQQITEIEQLVGRLLPPWAALHVAVQQLAAETRRLQAIEAAARAVFDADAGEDEIILPSLMDAAVQQLYDLLHPEEGADGQW